MVPLGRREVFGLVIQVGVTSQFDSLKPVAERVTDLSIDDHTIGLLRWVWQYYQAAPGEVCAAALPALLRQSSPYQPAPTLIYQLSEQGRSITLDTLKRAPKQQAVWQALADSGLTADQLGQQLPNWRPALRSLMAKTLVESIDVQPHQMHDAVPVTGQWQLTSDQHTACRHITRSFGHHQTWLLDGVTGSGKTAVYVHLLQHAIQHGMQGLVLVPEIGLVPQLVNQLSTQLGIQPGVYHSGLSDRERAANWLQFMQGNSAVLVGTRSAVFTPAKKLGCIIVDEEHDMGYKQFEGVHYHARDVAIKRASMQHVPVILGSATPSLETLSNVRRGRYAHQVLQQRHTPGGEPRWHILDCRVPQFQAERQENTATGVLHTAAIEEIRRTVNAGQQALIFLNRRGYAQLLQCGVCGWRATCPQCGKQAMDSEECKVSGGDLVNQAMTWHRSRRRLICHHCGEQATPPRVCPACADPDLLHAGPGTEKLEQALSEVFSDVPVYRVDSDSMRAKGKIEAMREAVLQEQACILVGTQMLSKGHHFPKITLVVAVDIDGALFSTDYRATERLLQQLIQVAGRAGRGGDSATMLLQSRTPEHPLLQQIIKASYAVVAEFLLSQRQAARLPPYTYQLVLRADSPKREQVLEFLLQARQNLPPHHTVEVHGPIPALLERRAGRYRYQLWVTAASRTALQKLAYAWVYQLEQLKPVYQLRWRIDVDPLEM